MEMDISYNLYKGVNFMKKATLIDEILTRNLKKLRLGLDKMRT